LGGDRIAITPYLPSELKEDVLREALEVARGIADEASRAKTLCSLAPSFSGELREDVVCEAVASTRIVATRYLLIDDIIHGSSYSATWFPSNVNALWATLVPLMSALPQSKLYQVWCDNLHFLSGQPRELLLSYIAFLSPVLMRLGGGSAVVQAADSVRKVITWWP